MFFLKHPFRMHGGTDIPYRKDTAHMKSAVMPPPAQVILPMQQHVGAPCSPLVKVGDSVLVGQKIADSAAPVSAPIHASISGTVSAVRSITLPGGQNAQAVVIRSDGRMALSPNLRPPVIRTKDDFCRAVRESGLVGLGGAGFPTHVKLNLPSGKDVDTLIVNLAECEPYLTSDHREALEDTDAVFSGIRAVRAFLGVKKVLIAVEDNKPDAIKKLGESAGGGENRAGGAVEVLALPSCYPQGAEKVLIKVCTGREIPEGKLPADVRCLVMNITSVGFLGNYLKTGVPLIRKRVTVDGSAVKRPQNVIAPIGTRIADVIAFAGGYSVEPAKILMGGPMMGLAVPDDQIPILKQNNGILAFGEKEARISAPTACIRCGRCVAGCPMSLIPTKLERYARAGNRGMLNELSVLDCIECGTCAYNCPAHRPLVQAIRLGKSIVKGGAKKHG